MLHNNVSNVLNKCNETTMVTQFTHDSVFENQGCLGEGGAVQLHHNFLEHFKRVPQVRRVVEVQSIH